MARVALDGAVDKVVVTNVDVLRAKYGSAGVATVRRALRTMAAEDASRDVTTVVADLASPTTATRVGAVAVEDPADHEATKRFVDALCAATSPDYVLLLGGPDVVAHVPLDNPVPAPDPDPDVPSDLPYACSAPPGTAASTFIGPDRVVGRLPDVISATGATAARRLAATIRRAARWSGAPADRYRDHLTVGTSRWQLSTASTAAALFGAGTTVHHAPPVASPLAPADLARPLHFINLHGATADTRWLGDPGFAVVLDVDDVDAHVAAGTVAVSEACFGGELFDPVLTGGATPFPVAYLTAGAYAVVGATSISYGGRLAPDAADVLCRYVVEEVLTGASLGRAVLQARQRYVRDQPVMTPVDLKTVAQFTLFGDPSIHPITAPSTGTRAMRRRNLAAAGPSIARSSAVAAGSGTRAGRALSFDVTAADLTEAQLPAQRIHVRTRRLRGPSRLARVEVTELGEDGTGLHPYRVLESKGGWTP